MRRFSGKWCWPEAHRVALARQGIYPAPMTLHPQIAALAGQMDALAVFLRGQGDRRWSGRVDLCAHLVADSNFSGVERFLRLFEGDESLDTLVLTDAVANLRLSELRKGARTLAERLTKEERAAD